MDLPLAREPQAPSPALWTRHLCSSCGSVLVISMPGQITTETHPTHMSLYSRNCTCTFHRRGKGIYPQSDWTGSLEARDRPGQGVCVAILREQECKQLAHCPGHVASGGHPEDPVQKFPRCPRAEPTNPFSSFSRACECSTSQVKHDMAIRLQVGPCSVG